MTFTFAAAVAWDPIGKQAVKNTSFQVYAQADTGFVTPLAITDTFGATLPGNILNSGSQGVFPEFEQVANSTVVITDPAHTYVWTVTAIMQDTSVAAFVGTSGSASRAAVKDAISADLADPASTISGQLTATIDTQLDGAGIKGVDDGSNATAFYKNAADKVAYTIGNAPGSAGFAGTGSPAKALGALAIYQKFGDATGGTNAPVTNTTQAAYLLANYYGPTADDSAEAFSTFVGVKNTGTGFTQAKPVTAFEAIAQVEGSNTVTGAGSYALGVGSRINVIGTAHVDDAYGFKASVNSSGGPVFGTIGNYRAFYQPLASGATNPYGLYVIDPANSESQVSVGRSAGTAFKVKWGGDTDGSTSLAQLGQPTVSYGTLSGTYTLTTTPQTLTTNSGATLPAGGGTFMLDSSSRTIVTYTAFSGTSISGATIASGSVATTNGQLILDPATPNTTTLRINAQRGQSKNITEWYDSGANLRVRVNAQGNLVSQGTSFFAANGSATTLAEMSGSAGYVRPGTTAGPGSRIFSGTGAPNVSTSVAGDTYIRTDTPTTANQRIYIATGANTWTGIV